MKLNGCDLISIMKAGRWTSLTFLTYIHNQVAHLGANITHRMATRVHSSVSSLVVYSVLNVVGKYDKNLYSLQLYSMVVSIIWSSVG
jgi:hypothetical protein